MRVGLVIKEFDSATGGAERYAVGLARQLVAIGHEVHVFCHRHADDVAGVTMHAIAIAGWPSSRRFLSFPTNARRAYAHSGLDIVHGLTQIWPQDVHRAGGGVHRTWVRIARPGRFGRALHQLTPRELVRRHIERSIYAPGNLALVQTNSELVRGHVIDEYGLDPERVVVVRNGVDHDLFHPGRREGREAVRARLGLTADEFVVLFASSNFVRKGLGPLIDAVAATGLTLVVAGGARPDAFARQAAGRGAADRVRFVGHARDIEALYGAADCFALPTRYDPFANACLEAMACGLPVVTTRTNGAAEILEEGATGFVVESTDDVDALTAALSSLAQPGRAAAMGRAAAAAAGAFTFERHAAETVDLYERARALRDWSWA